MTTTTLPPTANAIDERVRNGVIGGVRILTGLPVSYTHLTLPTICSV